MSSKLRPLMPRSARKGAKSRGGEDAHPGSDIAVSIALQWRARNIEDDAGDACFHRADQLRLRLLGPAHKRLNFADTTWIEASRADASRHLWTGLRNGSDLLLSYGSGCRLKVRRDGTSRPI